MTVQEKLIASMAACIIELMRRNNATSIRAPADEPLLVLKEALAAFEIACAARK